MATKTRSNKSTVKPFVPTLSGNLKNLLHQAQLIDKISDVEEEGKAVQMTVEPEPTETPVPVPSVPAVPEPSVTAEPEPQETDGSSAETLGDKNIQDSAPQLSDTSESDESATHSSGSKEREASVPAGTAEKVPAKQNGADTPNAAVRPSKQKQAKTTKDTVKSPSYSIPASQNGGVLWDLIVNSCDGEDKIPKKIGRNGTAQQVVIEKYIIRTLQAHPINGHSISTMINAILRSILLHYKAEFQKFGEEDSGKMY